MRVSAKFTTHNGTHFRLTDLRNVPFLRVRINERSLKCENRYIVIGDVLITDEMGRVVAFDKPVDYTITRKK